MVAGYNVKQMSHNFLVYGLNANILRFEILAHNLVLGASFLWSTYWRSSSFSQLFQPKRLPLGIVMSIKWENVNKSR